MSKRNKDPQLLFLIVSDWKVDEARAVLGKRRMTSYAPDARPAWSRDYGGILLDVQNLCGEYGGWIGSAIELPTAPEDRSDVSEESAKAPKARPLSGRAQLERGENLRKMLDAIAEFAQQGRVVLCLSTSQRDVEKTSAISGSLTADFLMMMPRNTPVVFTV